MEALTAAAAQGWEVRQHNFAQTICFSYPRQTQPISVTGTDCQLNCAHCGGHYLKHMKPLADIDNRESIQASSMLISGGCTAEGKVPIDNHVEKIALLKQNLRCNMHVGLVNDEDIAGIVRIADKVSFDLIGDDATIREVLGINRTVTDYAECYRKLRDQCAVVPHICIGLLGGKIQGEYRAMEILEEIGVDELTFIVFTPTRGTRFASCNPPDMFATVNLLVAARQKFPSIPIHLGCMRPGGYYRRELDQWAVRLGVNTIVNPVPDAVRVAKSLNLSIMTKEECCVL